MIRFNGRWCHIITYTYLYSRQSFFIFFLGKKHKKLCICTHELTPRAGGRSRGVEGGGTCPHLLGIYLVNFEKIFSLFKEFASAHPALGHDGVMKEKMQLVKHLISILCKVLHAHFMLCKVCVRHGLFLFLWCEILKRTI